MRHTKEASLSTPYGIYVHIPFCEGKCTYCDFLSFPGKQRKWRGRYIQALCKEIETRLTPQWSRPNSVFIGGGTPSSLSYGELETLFSTLFTALHLQGHEEITLEANPSSLHADKLKLIRRFGVNRLSLGVQSMRDADLQKLGRLHSSEEVVGAVVRSRRAGFENINLDLIYGLPGMTLDTWQGTLESALALEPNHLSLYQLQVEEGTAMARHIASGQWPAPDEEVAVAAWEMQISLLQRHGFTQYEISNYAQRGYASRHNQLYWEMQDYLGLGLGAVGWVRPVRYTNTDSISHYCAGWGRGFFPLQDIETLDRATQQAEMVIMALRMNRGLSKSRFKKIFGQSVEAIYGPVLMDFSQKGLLECTAERVRLTERGRLLGNVVFEGFL